jgi:very-short-patch-repair endonuclease
MKRLYREGKRKPIIREPVLLPNLTKETLVKLYWEEQKSTYQIAEEFGVSEQLIIRRMKRLNIPRRDASKAALNKGKEFFAKFIRQIMKRPTKAEKKLLYYIKKNNLPFQYVGDGKVIIGTKNPDFINEKEKQIIELFGRAFHTPNSQLVKDIPWHRTEMGAKQYYREHGYQCVVIWDDELANEKNVVTKITTSLNL